MCPEEFWIFHPSLRAVMQNFEWQTAWCTPWFQFCLPHSFTDSIELIECNWKHNLDGKNTTRFSQEGGGGGGKNKDIAWCSQQRAQLTHIRVKEPAMEAVRVPAIFCHKFRIFQNHIQAPVDITLYSHPVLSSCSNKTIFYCLQIQSLKVSLFCPGLAWERERR